MRARTKLSVLVAVAALGGTVSTAQAVTVKKVGHGGLVSPRHLDFSPSGNLYVAEAGRGGDGPCFVGGEGPACFGATGAVTKISRHGRQSRIVDGLASFANDPDGTAPPTTTATAASARTASPRSATMRSSSPTAARRRRRSPTATSDHARRAGRPGPGGAALRPPAVGATASSRFISVADIYAIERGNNPDGGAIDTNATDVLFDRGRFVISDAGGNDVLRAFGPHLSTLAVFPDRPGVPLPGGGTIDMQAVPTGIVEGPDGAYYMSQLTGFPFPVGGANVYRINPRTGKARIFAGGFTNIMDLAFDRRGTLYVLEIDHDSLLGQSTDGAIFAISRKGKRRDDRPARRHADRAGRHHRRTARRPLRDQQLALARQRGGAQDPRMTSQARRTSSSVVRSEPIASRST